ncbi:tRNA-dependent cyclodipeptide synthase [Streptomyces sp. NPDC002133]|uniref:tRNA-dependent cyclodipeptide synthase n=1 Tax=Streptomyces sp. NPDC002133 TaxID=3154409 RepID=UPI003323096D
MIRGRHAVIGVPPGNSHFSVRRVIDLVRWGITHFDRVDFVHTELHVTEMYEASGYDPDDARREAVMNLRGPSVLRRRTAQLPGHRAGQEARRDRAGGAARPDAAAAARGPDRAARPVDRVHGADPREAPRHAVDA